MCIHTHICTHRETHILGHVYTLMHILVHTHCTLAHTPPSMYTHTRVCVLFPLIACSH